MREFWNKKTVRIILSVLVALVIWFYVDSQDDTPRIVRVNDVPIEFIGEDVLMERGLLVTSDMDITVDLELSSSNLTVINNLERGKEKGEIRLRVNLGNITSTGPNTLTWNLILPDSVYPASVNVNYASVYSITVDVAELYSKSVPIRGERSGTPAEGYVVGEMTYDQDSITVSGEQLAVANISHALVTVDVSGATESFSIVTEFQLIDYNGDVIENSTFRTSVETVEVNVPILMIKELPLVVDFIESPGSTLDDVTVTIDPQTITVSGDSRSIGRLDNVTLTEINLSNLAGDTSFTVPIPVPSGSTSVSGETEATITIQFKDTVATQTFETTNISYINEPQGSTVTVVSKTLEVTLRGSSEELETLSGYNIRVVGDLTDISAESGSYTVPATVYVDGAEDVGAVGSYQITVQISN